MSAGTAPADGLLARLRQQTSTEHAALEASVPLMAEAVSREDYVRFLTLVGAFHATVEQQLSQVDGLANVITDLRERRKTELLKSDFAALGIDPALLSPAISSPVPSSGRCPIEPDEHASVPSIASIDRAVGVMYVLEGSTLGSQLLHRHLSVTLPDVMSLGSAFLRCYGARTGQMWSSFRRQLERATPTLGADAVVDAAREAFIVLLDWVGQSPDDQSTTGELSGKVGKRVA